jgi:hypothetical protein
MADKRKMLLLRYQLYHQHVKERGLMLAINEIFGAPPIDPGQFPLPFSTQLRPRGEAGRDAVPAA